MNTYIERIEEEGRRSTYTERIEAVALIREINECGAYLLIDFTAEGCGPQLSDQAGFGGRPLRS
jgi:hypothetical protein